MKKRICSLLLALALTAGLFLGGYQPAEAESTITSEWYNFRNSDANMAITTAKTPTSANEVVEKWAVSMGTGWTDAPSVQIIVDNCIVVMSNKTIKKLSLEDGSLVAEGTMFQKSAYSYVTPTYADGVIYCALSGGTVEAFDAKTLESKWIYTDELGGQDQSPITYADGYIYTGFWNSEIADANYVCLNAETGEKVWTKTCTGGFYWAGSVVVGDAVIVGGTDGAKDSSGQAPLYALNKLTGEVISQLDVNGDIYSSMAYADGKVYFVTRSGYLCSAVADSKTGALSDLKQVQFSEKKYATSTPVVYKGYVYFGADDSTFKVAKADTLEVIQSVSLQGPSKCSWLLSTAYEESEGYLYFYGTYNAKPGGISMVKVKASDPSQCELVELYTPVDTAKQEYCICSIICDQQGNLYYKNDSKHVFALTKNQAYLNELTPSSGEWMESFAGYLQNLELIVPIGTESVTFTMKANEGSTVTLNGGAATDAVTLKDGTAEAVFEVKNGTDTRTYTVEIREESADASLGAMKVSNSNSVTNTTNDRVMTPEFASDVTYYGIYDVPEGKTNVNVWPQAADENAVVKVYALSNVDTGKYDAETGEIAITGTNGGRARYAVYFEDASKPMAVKVVVTAEDGKTQQTYTMVISTEAAAEAAEALLEELKTPPVDPASPANVTVTIAVSGNVVLAQQSVTVEDLNKDGVLNVDEVLVAAHNAAYTGGAEAGYASMETQYGLAIAKLWGDTSGAYSYWLNNVSCMSLDDTVKEGDFLVAFVYKDATYWSDIYTTFGKQSYTATENGAVEVTMEQAGYDENWNTVFSSLTGADIRVYDENLNLLEDGYAVTELGDGSYGVVFAKAGNYFLIGTNESLNTVPAVCKVICEKGYLDTDVQEDGTDHVTDSTGKNDTTTGTATPDTGDNTPIVMYVVLILAAAGVAAAVLISRRRKENK